MSPVVHSFLERRGMSSHLTLIVAAGAAAVCGWAFAASQQPPAAKAAPDAKTELMDADRAFAKAAADKGLDGWMSFMADDAVRVQPLGGKAFVGKAAVRELDAEMFKDPKRKLVWEPTDGGAFADGKHGFTTGRYKVVVRTDDGKDEVRSTGAYVSWWRKGDDGQWKVILDTGAADPPKK
jgi:ketosteroid isomerase-like protein